MYLVRRGVSSRSAFSRRGVTLTLTLTLTGLVCFGVSVGEIEMNDGSVVAKEGRK